MRKRLVLVGAAGRMGQAIIQCLRREAYDRLELVAAIGRETSPLLGQDIGEIAGGACTGIVLSASLSQALRHADIVIDFTPAEQMMTHLALYEQAGVAVVTGSTGLTDVQMERLQRAAVTLPLLWAANMSLGINVLLDILRRTVRAVGKNADIEIIEAHHRNKIDAPSGTAKVLGATIADELGCSLAETASYGRVGNTGVRNKQEIGFSSIRAGDTFGEHTVLFGLIGERIELTHRASSRDCFAKGALQAAAWLSAQTAGWYSMADVLTH
ncbi:4-hydroxy-tetrahydrodipicolinate reductase [Piscirickettsia salmonis]|uniref:4-hydroxy-tetrahydrodipicolinate reductase n=1 Tax=Piscirickettsia salmonis TaxID=1238 RepID=A0A9Q6LVL9_PISSA|nr:4-hydroxy-tetrahydrodipicolinate reductase [Piscirickettsia salmonis]ALA23768.1 dihydrodipicolinate reductase [Piscirickettsia salmonis]APS44197.1 4-hydroxy-tetrahydrodipicolinate reductase [Piscirickettsia salmonis]APS47557.1 4-hydroxy-tetrahydrodipicolinate reductase [Piscirickettsia salmonis]APS51009.1 4-hydroxy-tetrahydrodipicolinate reductase [Piscirickettsia salmonis]APS54215.1 4-hydroxy-tetrahydrodipicolinate reductase [Piscirickettsia salmonis]